MIRQVLKQIETDRHKGHGMNRRVSFQTVIMVLILPGHPHFTFYSEVRFQPVSCTREYREGILHYTDVE